MINFINQGSDYQLLKSLHKDGLVQKEIQVKGKHGNFVRKQWVSANGTKPVETKPVKQEEKKLLGKTVFIPLKDTGSFNPRTFSYHDIVQYHTQNKIRTNLKEFIRQNYTVLDCSKSTRKMYSSKDLIYDRNRQKLHKQIIKQIVDSATTAEGIEQPIAVLMGGGSASGKGTIRDTKVIPKLQHIGINPGVSDCDNIKEQLPEYNILLKTNPSVAASIVQDESMDIAMSAMDEMIKQRKHFIFDGTMKDVVKYTDIIDNLHKAGYYVKIVGVDTELETAVRRSEKRAKKTKREVPYGIITSTHGGFASTYDKLLDKVDDYVLYDNTGSEPEIIQDTKKIYNQDKFNKFNQKGISYVTDKRIKNISRTYGVPKEYVADLFDNGATLDEIEEYYSLGLDEE